MNILPKKRWHVRTKENIARVRRDEAQAAEEEKERLRRIALAEQEFRTSLLRKKAAERRGDAITETTPEGEQSKPESVDLSSTKEDTSIVSSSGHINFFQHLEDGERTGGDNEDYVREQREEKEKYEKSIGYLTYLGQGSREETKQKAWFEALPVDRARDRDAGTNADEVKKKAKDFEDPLKAVKELVGNTGGESVSTKTLTNTSSEACNLKPEIRKLVAAEAPLSVRKRARDSSSDDDERRSRHRKHRKEKTKNSRRKHKKHKRSEEEPKRKHKSKKRSRRSPSVSEASSSEDSEDAERAAEQKIQLERMRAERLQRERAERERAEQLLRRVRGEAEPQAKPHEREPQLKQRYNAQFNPYLAKQNYRHE